MFGAAMISPAHRGPRPAPSRAGCRSTPQLKNRTKRPAGQQIEQLCKQNRIAVLSEAGTQNGGYLKSYADNAW